MWSKALKYGGSVGPEGGSLGNTSSSHGDILSSKRTYGRDVTVMSLNRDCCTGCQICMTVCPEQAISMEMDDGDFWVPSVDEKSCVKCGICKSNCPAFSGGVIQ